MKYWIELDQIKLYETKLNREIPKPLWPSLLLSQVSTIFAGLFYSTPLYSTHFSNLYLSALIFLVFPMVRWAVQPYSTQLFSTLYHVLFITINFYLHLHSQQIHFFILLSVFPIMRWVVQSQWWRLELKWQNTVQPL